MQTQNLNLHLYDEDENFQITGEQNSLNNNMNIIDESIGALLQQTPLFVNSIEECTDTTKLYVLPDGYVYAYIRVDYPKIIVTGGVGMYCNDHGMIKFTNQSTTYHNETEPIPVSKGDQLSFTTRTSSASGWAANGQYYDEYGNPMANGVILVMPTDNILENRPVTHTITIPEGVAYVKLLSFAYGYDEEDEEKKQAAIQEAKLVVTWVRCSHTNSEQKWKPIMLADYEHKVLHLESSMAEAEDHIKKLNKQNNRLKGKKIVFDGDSICADWHNKNGGAYPQIISDITGCVSVNEGVGGGRFVSTNGVVNDEGEPIFHSIVDNVSKLPEDGDLYCFEGGVNDHWKKTPLGDFNPTEYGESELKLDTTTFCGAFETVIRYSIDNFVGKPICVIITHKCPDSAYSKYPRENGKTFADFREKMIGICEKYSIPYYDAFKESGLNSWSAEHLDKYFLRPKDTDQTGDGTHPNEEGYKRYYVPQLISLFERILPQEPIEINIQLGVEAKIENLLTTYGYKKDQIFNDSGELMYFPGRYITGIIPCKSGEVFRLSNIWIPNKKEDHQNMIAYYHEDGAFNTAWNLTTEEGGSVDQANAIYLNNTLVEFTAPVNGYFRLVFVDIKPNASIVGVSKT